MGNEQRAISIHELEVKQSPVTFGQRIRQGRITNGFTLRSLASRVGISPSYLVALEKDANPKTGKPSTPSIGIVMGLSQELEIPKEELFLLRGEMYPDEVSWRPLLESGKGNSPEEFVCGILEAYVIHLNRLALFQRESLGKKLLSGEFDNREAELVDAFRATTADFEFYTQTATEVDNIRKQLNEITRSVFEKKNLQNVGGK